MRPTWVRPDPAAGAECELRQKTDRRGCVAADWGLPDHRTVRMAGWARLDFNGLAERAKCCAPTTAAPRSATVASSASRPEQFCFAFCEYRPIGERIQRQTRGVASDAAPLRTKNHLDTIADSMIDDDSSRPGGVVETGHSEGGGGVGGTHREDPADHTPVWGQHLTGITRLVEPSDRALGKRHCRMQTN